MDARTERMLAERQVAEPTPQGAATIGAWLSVNWFRAAIALTGLVIALSIAHYAMVTLPAQRAAQAEAARRQGLRAVDNDVSLRACLADADRNYAADWEHACETRGLGPNCSLPGVAVDRHDERRAAARNECFRQFPVR